MSSAVVVLLVVLALAAGSGLTLLVQAARRAAGSSPSTLVHGLADELASFAQSSASPADLRERPQFRAAVELLESSQFDSRDVLAYALGDNWIISAMALEALSRRGDRAEVLEAVPALTSMGAWPAWYLYRALEATVPPAHPLVGYVLSHAGESWEWTPYHPRFFEEFARNRLAAGESFDGDAGFVAEDPDRQEAVERVLRRLDREIGQPLKRALERFRRKRVDLAFLEVIGRLRELPQRPPLAHQSFDERLALLERRVLERRSVALVGEGGVGKTALVDALTARLAQQGHTVFEAGGTDLVAGQMYRGQFERRLRQVVAQLEDAPVIWYVPDLAELRWAGTASGERADVLDYLLPAVERGGPVILTECPPLAWDRLADEKPRLKRTFEKVVVEPLDEEATLDLARRWAKSVSADETPVAGDELIREAAALARQFLVDRASPGDLLELLDSTHRRLTMGTAMALPPEGAAANGSPAGTGAAAPPGGVELSLDDLIATLEGLTGLPASLLDDRRSLDVGAVLETFENQLLGQAEAVECLVERIAMIKAGVCDPTRPLGVFLFAGPTGTGKTEAAKMLARYLFGSEERMVRLDMSEFQTPDSLGRILGESGAPLVGGSLADQVRKQPFSVVLLDEFEKSAPNVWDLFLQVFDDGRLTDRRGLVTDFRNSLVILTSNLGAAISSGDVVGFAGRAGRFSGMVVERQIRKAFRPEFLNRIDRIVVFRPFSRDVMRELLEKEVKQAFLRRGLRRREWAVEWDSTATDFLLERGFTVDLGARPLRRAVERHLLAPLARVIVDGRVPEGDQFLFVRSAGDRLVVEFVDPEAPVSPPSPLGEDEADDSLSLERMILSPRGEAREAAQLAGRIAELDDRLSAPAWQSRKDDAYRQMSEAGFWERDDRFEILGTVDAVDRIGAAARTVRSLRARLERHETPPLTLVERLARKLFLLEAAVRDLEQGVPWDAFLGIELGPSSGKRAAGFADELEAMYRSWGETRGMRVELLERSGDLDRGRKSLFAIFGFSAWSLLAPENGIHLLELPAEGSPSRTRRRVPVRVRVAPQTGAVPDGSELLDRARAALDVAGTEAGFVRRYRREPSPLVRDSVRGFKTGRLDRVLRGDFDLLGGT